MADGTPIFIETRPVRRAGSPFSESDVSRIGHAQLPPIDRRYFQLLLSQGAKIEPPPSLIRSEVLGESFELADWPVSRNHFSAISLEKVDSLPGPLLVGDPFAAMAIKSFVPELEWVRRLCHRQVCPFCRGTCYALPVNYWDWSREYYPCAINCVRRGCGWCTIIGPGAPPR